jgi:hypothetical protein
MFLIGLIIPNEKNPSFHLHLHPHPERRRVRWYLK